MVPDSSKTQSKGQRLAKPSKPYPEIPLFAHQTGRWAKNIKGRFHYFDPWKYPNAALEKYLSEKDYLHAGKSLLQTGLQRQKLYRIYGDTFY